MNVLQTEIDFSPRVLVRSLAPICDDGREWEARLERVYLALARMLPAGFYASELRATAASMGLGEPPHGSGAWGRVASRMKHQGWTTEIRPRTSTTASRNQATEFRVWMPPHLESPDTHSLPPAFSPSLRACDVAPAAVEPVGSDAGSDAGASSSPPSESP